MGFNESAFDWRGFSFFSKFALSLVLAGSALHWGTLYAAAALWPLDITVVEALPAAAAAKAPIKPAPDVLYWREMAAEAAWAPRDSAATFVFGGRMWIMGGLNGNGVEAKPDHAFDYSKAVHYNDIWSSEDGREWRQEAASAAWSPRRSMTVVEFKGRLYMLGGWSPTEGYKSEVWVSDDAVNWSRAVAQAPWPAREGHTLDVWQGRLWLMGGVNYQAGKALSDVWYSQDGTNWSQVPSAPWTARWDHGSAVLGDRLYVAGGMLYKQTFRDVWSTKDGLTWERMPTPPWTARQGHHLVAMDDRMYSVGRLNDDTEGGSNDIWYTQDGKKWQKTVDEPAWLGREDHGVLSFNDRLWVLGGMDRNWRWRSDVWQSSRLSELEPPPVSAKAALVVEFGSSTGSRVVHAHNESRPLPIASMTKLMTALVASELYAPRDTVVVGELAAAGKGLSGLYRAGDAFYMEDALYALLMASHNEMANALAQKTSEEYFVARMNERAGLLGMTRTRFVNASGLDPDVGEINTSSASDMAVLLRYIYQERPELFAVLSTKQRLFNKQSGAFVTTLSNTNALLGGGSALPVVGGKTGETPLSGHNLAAIAQTEAGFVLSVIIGSQDSFADTKALLRYAKDSSQ